MSSGGTLSKVIPRHTRSVRFIWCKRDFMNFGVFKAARARMNITLLQGGRCYWCHRPFHDDDMMALAAPEKSANKLLCQECASGFDQQHSEESGAPRREAGDRAAPLVSRQPNDSTAEPTK